MGFFNATATYGHGFKPTEVADQYKMRVYVGGFAGGNTAESRMVMEADQFKIKEGYKSYEKVHRRFSFIPSYYEYTLQFHR